ncbi:hypothetical protein HDU91_002731 [Kappamyces sp. JEL0680]|nr:hypothetical protein HDU91_002731 [Kappamyces sp. JEL0680]
MKYSALALVSLVSVVAADDAQPEVPAWDPVTITLPSGGNGKCFKKNRPQAPAKPASPPAPTGAMVQDCLNRHNFYRRQMKLPDVTWDGSLASSAGAWSQTIAALGYLKHGGSPGGQNLFTQFGGTASCVTAIDAWYREGGGPYALNHYTQVMWKDTQKIGCAQVNGYLTCNYLPGGNVIGRSAY